ncbi:MAG: hypothetical protein LWW88_03105 [Acinetobacter sp.]|uniref:hypothetical protein n=1 Tax=Acinetobacter TaxID=469 RepID=UPI000B254A9F|nr:MULTISPECIES: hypothetical protein [unclassified Acinetobacter]MCE1270545.1 hypothetical protein [Acinetobacter sp.]
MFNNLFTILKLFNNQDAEIRRIAVTRSLGLVKVKIAISKLLENFQHDISNQDI